MVEDSFLECDVLEICIEVLNVVQTSVVEHVVLKTCICWRR